MNKKVSFYAPGIKRYETSEFSGKNEFLPVSITGSVCKLGCDHCKARVLQNMKFAETPSSLFEYAKKIKDKGVKGLLISGGSDKDGVVPINGFLETIKRIKAELNLKITIHIGKLDEETACKIKDTGIDGCMMDIIGSNETMKEVCHLEGGIENIENTLRLLCDYGINAIPHIVIGIHYGKIIGEYDALRMLSQYPINTIVLVGLFPQQRTPMEGVMPPKPLEMANVFQYARELFPDKRITLGCQRPLGRDKFETEVLALKIGLDGIAYPSEGIVKKAKEMGYITHFSYMCCSIE